jgi:hypothetical protein
MGYRYGGTLYPLSDGRFGISRIEQVAPLMSGYRYALAEKPFAAYLRALNLWGLSFRPTVIWDRSTNLEHHSHEQMLVEQRFTWDQICSLNLDVKRILTINDELSPDPGRKRILTIDDRYVCVSHELKEELENSSFEDLLFAKLGRSFDSLNYLAFRKPRTQAPVKKPLALTAVVSDLVDMLCRIRTKVDELVRSGGIDQAPHHGSETSAFVYILGWYALHASRLSRSDWGRLDAELRGAFAKRMASDSSDERVFSMFKLLEDRESFYTSGYGGPDGIASTTIQFMHFLGYDQDKNVALYTALHGSTAQHFAALKDFLTRHRKTYRFV